MDNRIMNKTARQGFLVRKGFLGMTTKGIWGIVLVMMIASMTFAEEQATTPVYLSDIQGAIILNSQDWGELGIDCCAHVPGQQGLPLQIKDQIYEKGLGSHANGPKWVFSGRGAVRVLFRLK